MFSSRRNRVTLGELDNRGNVVWFGSSRDRKYEVTGWAHPEFYQVWYTAMGWAFDLVSMQDKFREICTDDRSVQQETIPGLESLRPVPGHQNRTLLSKATFNLEQVTTTFGRKVIRDGIVIYHEGNLAMALEQWKAIAELVAQTTVMAIVTPGLEYYVQGTEVGYSPSTRHLFRHGNTVQRIGLPNEPHWVLNVSGYTVDIRGKWDEITKTRRENGYNVFQMLQLRINEELEEAIRREV